MSAEFGIVVQTGNVNLQVISTYMMFKITTAQRITKGAGMRRAEQGPSPKSTNIKRLGTG